MMRGRISANDSAMILGLGIRVRNHKCAPTVMPYKKSNTRPKICPKGSTDTMRSPAFKFDFVVDVNDIRQNAAVGEHDAF